MPGSLHAAGYSARSSTWLRYFNWFLGTFRERNTFNLIRQRSREASNDSLMQIETGTYWNALFFRYLLSYKPSPGPALLAQTRRSSRVLFFLRTMHISCLLIPRTALPIFSLLIISRELCLRLFLYLLLFFYYTSSFLPT